MTQETLYIAAAIFAGIYAIASLIYYLFRQHLQLKQKEFEMHHARLDDFRAHLERQLMELNVRFASSDGRWRELNHLVVAGQKENESGIASSGLLRPAEFLKSHGIDSANLEIRQDLIFVLTPFHDDLRSEFNAIVEVGRELGLNVVRGDEKAQHGDIFPQLLRLIVSARVIVANISGRNPNVFYELGIAHALGKPVILIAHNEAEVPFDIRSKRIVFYQSAAELRERFALMLTRTVLANDK